MADDKLELEGVVAAARGNGNFIITPDNGAEDVLCTLSGKIRKNNIKILEGDSVKIEVSVYDLTRGRITYRNNKRANKDGTK
jgi:translation initiation factor IF-1